MDHRPPADLISRYLVRLERHRRALSWLLALAGLAGVWRASTLTIETDWSRLFPYPRDVETVRVLGSLNTSLGLTFFFSDAAGRPILDRLDEVTAQADRLRAAGLFRHVVFGMDSARPAGTALPWLAFMGTNEVRELVSRLTPDGMRARVRDTVRMFFTPAGGLVREQFLADPLQLNPLAGTALQARLGFRFQDGHLVSDDGRTLLVIALPPPDPAPGWLDGLAALMTQLRHDADAGGLRCRMPGSLFLRAELLASVRHDLVVTFLGSLASVIALFLVAYRGSLRVVWCIMLPLLLSLSLTFGISALIRPRMDLITALSAAMLVGLGVDFGIHLLAGYADAAGTPAERLATAFRVTGPGILSGALTTAAAFFSILITGMRSFYLLGLTAGAGILLAVLCFAVAFPLSIFGLRPAPRPAPAGADRGFAFSVRWAAPVLMLLVAASPFVWGRLHFITDFQMFLPAHSQALDDLRALEPAAGGGPADGLVLQTAARGYRADAALVTDLQAASPGAAWKSPFLFLPAPDQLDAVRRAFLEGSRAAGLTLTGAQAALRATLAEAGLRSTPKMDDYLAGVFAAFTNAALEAQLYALPLAAPFFSPDRQQLLLMATRPGGAAWSAGDLATLTARLETDGRPFSLISGRILMDRLRRRAIPESLLAAAFTMACVGLTLTAHFRRAALVVLAALPLAGGLLLTMLIMGVFRLSFNFFNLTVLPLIFGLGIDNGIHYAQALAVTGSAKKALARIRRPIMLTTLTTCLGFGSLATVAFKGVALMGLMVILGLASCWAITVGLLPACARRWEQVRRNG